MAISDEILLEKYLQLPDHVKLTVDDFVDFLLQKYGARDTRKPAFGSAKGMLEMLPGFDEPLGDFDGHLQK